MLHGDSGLNVKACSCLMPLPLGVGETMVVGVADYPYAPSCWALSMNRLCRSP